MIGKPTTEEIARAQATVQQIGERLSSDASFRTQYQADKMGTLTSAGLSPQAAQALVSQTENEVAGYDDGGYHYTLDNPNNW